MEIGLAVFKKIDPQKIWNNKKKKKNANINKDSAPKGGILKYSRKSGV